MNYDLTDFQTDVMDRSQHVPVLVDFWAAWCGPCKMLGPVLEKLAAEAAGKWELVKIDTEAHPELAEQFQIRGIPDVRLFHQGSEVARFSGALPEPHLRQWLGSSHIPHLIVLLIRITRLEGFIASPKPGTLAQFPGK